eukprot:5246890-Alexandrium_andersonii.AAC.1
MAATPRLPPLSLPASWAGGRAHTVHVMTLYNQGEHEGAIIDELIRRGYRLFSWSEVEEHRRAQPKSCRPRGAEWFKPALTEE